MSRWDSTKGKERSYTGAYSASKIKLITPEWAVRHNDYNNQKDISGIVDKAHAVNGGFAGKLPTRDTSNRAKAPAGRGKTTGHGGGNVSGQRLVRGRRSFG